METPNTTTSQNANTPAPVLPKKRRSWWFWLFSVGGGLLLVAVAGIFVGDYWAMQELARAHAEIEKTDPHWRIWDIDDHREVLPDDQNGALQINKVFSLVAVKDPTVDHPNLFENLKPQHLLNPEQITALRQYVRDNADSLAEADKLRFFASGRFKIKQTDNPLTVVLNIQPAREVINLLNYQAMLQAEDQEIANALQACEAMVGTARAIGDEPFLISMLVRIALRAIAVNAIHRALAQGEAPEEALARLQESLAKEMDTPLLKNAMRGERGIIGQMFQNYRNGKLTFNAMLGGGGMGLDFVPRVFVVREYLHLLETMNQAVDYCDLPPWEREAKFEEQQQQVLRSTRIMTKLLLPAVQKVVQADTRIQAAGPTAVAGIAAERFRLKHGRWPTTLDDLVANKFLTKVPTDPFNGQPIRCKKLADGFVVYSVGFDGEDNGGTLWDRDPREKGKDIGFRLWDPTARRQPAIVTPSEEP